MDFPPFSSAIENIAMYWTARSKNTRHAPSDIGFSADKSSVIRACDKNVSHSSIYSGLYGSKRQAAYCSEKSHLNILNINPCASFGVTNFSTLIRILLCGSVVVSESQYSTTGDGLAVSLSAASRLSYGGAA